MVTMKPYSLFKKAICYTHPPRGESDERCLSVKFRDRKYFNDFEMKGRSSYMHLN